MNKRALRIKDLMIDSDGTVKDFCKRIGVPYTTIYTNLDSDAKLDRMSISNFVKVADGLDMSPDELLERIEHSVEPF